MALLIRFRSAHLRSLVENAVSQGFAQEVRGSGHLGLVCPTCKRITIFSGSQPDRAEYKYLNQVANMRNHGMVITGKKTKGCRYGVQ